MEIREEVGNPDERRLAPRVPLAIKFFYALKQDSENCEAITKNISASGMLFENPKQIPIDEELKIFIKLPGVEELSLAIGAKVVRLEKISAERFNIGVYFNDLLEGQKEQLRQSIERIDILRLLEKGRLKDISDLHLTVGSPPMMRYCGEIKPLEENTLTEEQIRQMIYSILSDAQKKRFEVEKDLDFAFSPTSESRYRVSIYKQRGKTEVVFRNILANIKGRQELGLPEIIEDLCQFKDGIIFIGGTTGSGKTTTISTMVDIINRRKAGVILSLEKPIEYMHKNIKSIVKQREVGTDVESFAQGLKAAMRQDPDVIVVGEILDSDSVETVLEAAETGHLVITSMHATDAVQVFDRIISFFPLSQRDFIYSRLSYSLRAVIIQTLLVHKDGVGRALATEVCVANSAVRRILRSGDFTQLPSVIQTGSKYKMHLMQDSIDKLFEQGLISAETYDEYSKDK